MLDKNEGHSRINGKVLQESCKRLQPSGGCAYRNNGERNQRQQILLFVRCNRTAGRVISIWCIHRRSGRGWSLRTPDATLMRELGGMT